MMMPGREVSMMIFRRWPRAQRNVWTPARNFCFNSRFSSNLQVGTPEGAWCTNARAILL